MQLLSTSLLTYSIFCMVKPRSGLRLCVLQLYFSLKSLPLVSVSHLPSSGQYMAIEQKICWCQHSTIIRSLIKVIISFCTLVRYHFKLTTCMSSNNSTGFHLALVQLRVAERWMQAFCFTILGREAIPIKHNIHFSNTVR